MFRNTMNAIAVGAALVAGGAPGKTGKDVSFHWAGAPRKG
jgi:hypothetical protein